MQEVIRLSERSAAKASDKLIQYILNAGIAHSQNDDIITAGRYLMRAQVSLFTYQFYSIFYSDLNKKLFIEEIFYNMFNFLNLSQEILDALGILKEDFVHRKILSYLESKVLDDP